MDSERIKEVAKKFLEALFLFIKTGEYKKHYKVIFTSLALLCILFVSSHLLKPTPVKKKIGSLSISLPTIPGAGEIPALHLAMKGNTKLRKKVEILWGYETQFLFFNYQQVDSELIEILFRWSGIEDEELSEMNIRQGVHHFIRKIYGLDEDESVAGNSLLGERPWPTLFNRYKARFLMQGAGRNIYEGGEALYDTRLDQMIVTGNLSSAFIKDFKLFITGRPDAVKYVNNLVSFIDETKGLRNLSDEEFAMVKSLKGK